MQRQADVLGVAISRPEILETTALGSAFLAGLGVGMWKSPSEIAAVWKEERRFTPAGDAAEIAELIERWNQSVERA
jgi:glycerol kinase